MEYELTEDTKGCLHCGQLFEARRTDALFCSQQCKAAHHALPPEKRFLNPPIINRQPLTHGDLYTTEGDIMQLENGIMRVRRRFEDPEVVKAQKSEKDEKEPTVKFEAKSLKPAKRRGA